MAKSDTKVKELAKELGVTSRALIDLCRERGIWVQNSITRLPAAKASLIRTWFPITPPTDATPESPTAPRA